MNLYIFATQKDLSAQSIVDEGNKNKLKGRVVFYENIAIDQDRLKHNNSIITFGDNDKILVRWPWDASNTDIEYNNIVKYLCAKYPDKIALDLKCLRDFSPKYEDKYFQYQFFKRLNVPTPDVCLVNELDEAEKTFGYPMVIKKRISSRSKSNYLIENREQFEFFKKKIIPEEYILQAKVQADKDLRVLMLNGQLLGVVSRLMHIREENRLSVKGMEPVDKIDSNIITDAKRLSAALGGDLIGFDVLVEKSGKYYFIEANLSPQFTSFMQVTGTNVSSRIIEEIFKGKLSVKP